MLFTRVSKSKVLDNIENAVLIGVLQTSCSVMFVTEHRGYVKLLAKITNFQHSARTKSIVCLLCVALMKWKVTVI